MRNYQREYRILERVRRNLRGTEVSAIAFCFQNGLRG